MRCRGVCECERFVFSGVSRVQQHLHPDAAGRDSNNPAKLRAHEAVCSRFPTFLSHKDPGVVIKIKKCSKPISLSGTEQALYLEVHRFLCILCACERVILFSKSKEKHDSVNHSFHF